MLFDRHVIAAPERHAVKLHAQPRGGKAGHQQLIAFQFLARPGCERMLARQPQGLPLHRSVGTGLNRNQEPLVRLRELSCHRAGRGFLKNPEIMRLAQMGCLSLYVPMAPNCDDRGKTVVNR